jgi:ADP-ribose pyrophosphatase
MSLVERTVRIDSRAPPEPYYFVRQRDYVSMLAITPDGKIPLVRQYRPAAGRVTLELPAGTVEEGDTPESTCNKELLEETGLRARRTHYLGTYFCDTGRLGNRVHNFLVETRERGRSARRTAELEVRFVSGPQLIELCTSSRFDLQLHLGTVWLAQQHPRAALLLNAPRVSKGTSR